VLSAFPYLFPDKGPAEDANLKPLNFKRELRTFDRPLLYPKYSQNSGIYFNKNKGNSKYFGASIIVEISGFSSNDLGISFMDLVANNIVLINRSKLTGKDPLRIIRIRSPNIMGIPSEVTLIG